MSDYQTKVNINKAEAVAVLQASLALSSDFFFADYRGMTVEQMRALRVRLQEHKASFRVVKNRYAKIALSNLKKPEAVSDLLSGPTAITAVEGESSPVAKILFEMAKEMPLEIKGGLIGSDLFNASQVEAYSKLPTRDELLSSLMGTMKAPVQSMVYLLNAVPTKLVRTLQAVADQKAGA